MSLRMWVLGDDEKCPDFMQVAEEPSSVFNRLAEPVESDVLRIIFVDDLEPRLWRRGIGRELVLADYSPKILSAEGLGRTQS